MEKYYLGPIFTLWRRSRVPLSNLDWDPEVPPAKFRALGGGLKLFMQVMFCVGDAKIFLKEVLPLQKFLLFQHKSFCSSKNELSILPELLKKLTFKYFLIMK